MHLLTALANEAQLELPPSEFLGNGEVSADGWALIPYGDWPHEMGIQKFHKPQAQQIVQAFREAAGRFFARATVGLPIVKGHPDHPSAAIANQYPDKEEKGQIADMEARDDGLALRLVLSNNGAELVRKGWKFISPLWLGSLVSKVGGLATYAPTKMVSVGLVSRPNIPVQSLANAHPALITSAPAAATNNTKPMNPKLLKLLGLPETATEAEFEQAVTALHNSSRTLANEQSARTAAEGRATAAESAKTAAEAKATTAETALANERKARITDAINRAVLEGRITEADKPTWEKRLAKDEAEFAALANSVPVVKTKSEIDAALRKYQTALENAISKGQKEPDGDEDDMENECGLSNEEIDAMDNSKKGAMIKKMIAKHLGNSANTPANYQAAFAAAKLGSPYLFGIQPDKKSQTT